MVELRDTLSEAVRGILDDPSIGEDARRFGVSAVQCLYAIEALDRSARQSLLDRASEHLHALGHSAPRARTAVFLGFARRVQQLTPKTKSSPGKTGPHLDVTVNHESHSNFFTGVSGDILDGGVFVATDSLLPVGTPVSLKVSLPAGKLISRGRVSFVRPQGELERAQPQGMGIRLSSPSLLQQEPVMKLLARREPLFEP